MKEKVLNNIREWVSTAIGTIICIGAVTSHFTHGTPWEGVAVGVAAGKALIFLVGGRKKDA